VIGFLLAFGTAASEAAKDIVSKYNLRHVDEYAAAFSMHLVQTALLLPLVIAGGWVDLTLRYGAALAAGTAIQLAVSILYMKALRTADISTTVPLLALTPLFMLITSPIMVGEFPSALGFAGIVFIVVGTYASNLSGGRGVLAPFKSLVMNEGPRYMLVVAFLWSITANIDKVGVEATTPVFWVFTKDAVILAYLVPILRMRSSDPIAQLRSRPWPLFLVGAFRASSALTQMFAIQLILVAYVISIKRASAILILAYAFFFMGERENIRARLVGMTCIVIGLVMIALS
jgi:uncharacterized membrane protein